MYERGYIVAGEGNLSVRLDADRILTTPTCINKGMMTPSDLVVMDMEGRHLQGDRKISSEAGMHLLFYRMRSDVQAVCHGHPATATGFAVAGQGLDQALLPEVVVSLGKIPLVRYATPGTPDLSAVLEPYVPHYDALLLADHGAVTCGPDLLTAFFRIEVVEHFAKITLAARLAGEPQLLSTREVAKLMAARARYHVTPPPGGGADFPKLATTVRTLPTKSLSRVLNLTPWWTRLSAKIALAANCFPHLLSRFPSLLCLPFFLSHPILAGRKGPPK